MRELEGIPVRPRSGAASSTRCPLCYWEAGRLGGGRVVDDIICDDVGDCFDMLMADALTRLDLRNKRILAAN